MKKLLLSTAVLLAMTMASEAGFISSFGVNPTSAAGAFSNDPNGLLVGGLFTDQYTFDLIGGPAFVSVVTASNTFAAGGITGPFGIQNFVGSIYETTDAIIGNGDDVLRFGPQNATLCASGLCQELNGNGIIFPGHYYLQISGDAGVLAGYGGNLSVAEVPGPVVGAGIPGLIAACGLMLGLARNRKRKNGLGVA